MKILKADSIDFIEKSVEEEANEEELASENIYVDRHPNDTEIGTFQIGSSNDNFLLRIGGFVKLAGYYDAGLENELFFNLYKITTTDARPLGRFNMHAYESRLNMEVFGKTSLGLFRIFIEGDFMKDNNGGLRLRHALGQFRGFTFGQTWTYFMDLDASPVSIDFYGTNTSTFGRKPLIRYKYVREEQFEAGLSIENPSGNIFRNQDTARHQLYPDVVAKFKKFIGRNHIEVAGVFRSFIFKNSLTGEEKVTDGYGVYVSGRSWLTRNLNFYSQVVYGNAIADYIALNPVLTENENGDFSTTPIISGVAGINYLINYRSAINVFGSYVNHLDTRGREEETFREGFQFNANYLYNILPSLKTGVELIYGRSRNVAGSTGNASRIYILFQFDF